MENNTSMDAFTSALKDVIDTEGRLSRLEEKAKAREKGEEEMKASIQSLHDRVSTSKKDIIEEMDKKETKVLEIRNEDKKELVSTRKYAAGILITLVIILIETVIALFIRT